VTPNTTSAAKAESIAEPTWFCPPAVEDAAEFTDGQILRRLAFTLRGQCNIKGRSIAWGFISDLLGHGSGYSIEICRRLGIDPDRQMTWSISARKVRRC
jgi:hypothetical protein